jgi:hypothetical protein
MLDEGMAISAAVITRCHLNGASINDRYPCRCTLPAAGSRCTRPVHPAVGCDLRHRRHAAVKRQCRGFGDRIRALGVGSCPADEMREEAEAQPIPAVGLRSCRPSGDREDHLQAGVNTAGTSRMAVIRHDPGTCARILPLMWRDSSKTSKTALYAGPAGGCALRDAKC